MPEKVNSIIRVFPDYAERIERLFIYDESFRDLCADYILCANRVRELKSDVLKCQDNIDEYEEVQHQLEDEILKFVVVKSE